MQFSLTHSRDTTSENFPEKKDKVFLCPGMVWYDLWMAGVLQLPLTLVAIPNALAACLQDSGAVGSLKLVWNWLFDNACMWEGMNNDQDWSWEEEDVLLGNILLPGGQSWTIKKFFWYCINYYVSTSNDAAFFLLEMFNNTRLQNERDNN
jgi:hypothetical protein